jgi:hypothetical protein
MPLLPRFDTPAFLADVPAGSPFFDHWSAYISSLIGGTITGDGGGAFYNPMLTDVDIAGEKLLTWMGFPRDVLLSPTNRDNTRAAYIEADADPMTRSRQNEYFEWRVDRSPDGKITKLTFVTETPEYYEQLWTVDRAAVVNIYRTLVSPAVAEADLHMSGVYNRFNRWNTTDGIVHYIQSINTLSAAIGLSKGAIRSPMPFNDNYEAQPSGSNAFTSVDPRVAIDIHMLVRKRLYVTLRNPVGFFIAGWDGSGITHPDGTPAGNYWRIVRGTPAMPLRLEYEVPAALGFVVGDMKIGGRPIEFGGQLAEHITVSIAGIAGTSKSSPI